VIDIESFVSLLAAVYCSLLKLEAFAASISPAAVSHLREQYIFYPNLPLAK
jgi:hypothetical protein